MTRTCRTCHQELLTTFFPINSRASDGLDSQCERCRRDGNQRRKHGLTGAERAEIASTQGGCAICGHSDPGVKGWVIDHDRACCEGDRSCPKCRRGVLCLWCNNVLGYAFDRPEILAAAVEYLRRRDGNDPCYWHRGVPCRDDLCIGSSNASEQCSQAFMDAMPYGENGRTYGDFRGSLVDESPVTNAREFRADSLASGTR